jgi:serine/threonine-protein kinase
LRPGSAEATATSIAVLPFANLSGDAAQAYFSDGLSEELRSSLSRIAGLQVAARTSSELMRNADVKEAAAKLGVEHVLTGSVRKGGGTIRVSTQLLNGKTGLETWSEVYDRPQGDALVIQTTIARSVTNALSLSLGNAAAQMGATTRNPAAYDAFLRGIAITDRDEAGFRARVAAFDKAIAIDPDFAAAHASRSITLTNLFWEVGGADVLDAAGRDTARAVTLAPTLPLVQSALGYYQIAKLDFRGAAQSYDRLLQNPDLSRGLSAPGVFLVHMGRTEEGLMLVEKAVALDPLNALVRVNLGNALIASRQGKAALVVGEAINSDFPEQNVFNSVVGRSLLLLNRPAEALAAFAPVKNPRIRAWGQGVAYAMLGDRAGSDKALAALKADYPDIGSYQITCVHAARGEVDLALAALDHAIAVRSRGLQQLRSDFAMDPLRKDPRFIAIEKQLGFPPQ